jgi:hypothetical protein
MVFVYLVVGVAASARADAPILPADGTPVPNEYIVVFENEFEAADMMDRMQRWSGGRMMRAFELVLPGGLFRMTPAQARRGAQMPGVAYIEENAVVTLDATQANPPSYGLDRIDQRALPLSRGYDFDFTGAGVNLYVIDSGIRASHVDFGGRASLAADFVGDGRNGEDCNGHGTHVAGTAGSSTFGVAKGVRLFSLRVFGCSGSTTNDKIISAVDFVARNGIRPTVANMSLGGGASTALDNAVNNAVAAGVFIAVAAGNSNRDACTQSPARAQRVFTVAASDANDARASFSNFGTCVEIFAPGVSIPSLSNASDTGNRLLSGTSMSSPHVAGAAALVLQQVPTRTPAEVGQALLSLATPNVIRNPGTGTPNRLLFTPRGAAAPAPGALLSATFDADAQGFAFQPNAFRGTTAVNFAAGAFDAAGGAAGGGLAIALGGRDNTVVNGMSGAFARTFSVASATTATARVRIMLTQAANYEADEFSDALLSIDGRLVGTGGNDFLRRVTGDGNGGAVVSTGWVSLTVPLGQLAAGNHTLRIGGFNSKKTLADESTEIRIDDVQVTTP